MGDPLFTMVPDAVLRGYKYDGVHTRDSVLVLSYLVRLVQAKRLEDLTVARVARTLRMDRKTVKGICLELHKHWGIVTEKFGNSYRELYGNSYRDLGELLPKLSGIVTEQEKRKETRRDRIGRFSPIGNSSLVTNQDQGLVPEGPRPDGLDRVGEKEGRGGEEPVPKPPDLERLNGWHQGKTRGWMVIREGGKIEEWEEGPYSEDDIADLKKVDPNAIVIPKEFDRFIDKNGVPLNMDEVQKERDRQKKYRESVSQKGGQTNGKAKK